MSDFDNTDRSAYVTLGALFGVAAGIGLGMLMAPKSGTESREELRHKADDLKEKARRHFDDTKSTVAENLDKAADKGSELANKAEREARRRSRDLEE